MKMVEDKNFLMKAIIYKDWGTVVYHNEVLINNLMIDKAIKQLLWLIDELEKKKVKNEYNRI